MARAKIARTRTIVENQSDLGRKLDPPVSSRTVKQYVSQGMPGTPGNWCLEDCQTWVNENVRHRGEKRPRSSKAVEGDPLLNEPTSPGLELYRKRRAEMARLDLLERKKQLIPREKVHELLLIVSGVIRTAGETLQRQFGPDAARVLEEALNDADRHIHRFITDARADRSED